MAYQKKFNPDALPAHAEPEQAAQMIGALQPKRPTPPAKDVPPSSQSNPARRPSPHQYNSNISHHDPRLGSPPPPQNYGYGPPPPNPSHNLPPQQYRPPRTPQPPSGDPAHQDLFPLFRAANVSATGSLSESELGSALVNGDFTSFDPATVRMMMGMFSKESPGNIGYEEFVSLWAFLAAWRTLFERFDVDNSGRVNKEEFSDALVSFGYRLSPQFVDLLFRTFAKRVGGRGGVAGAAGRAASFGQATTWNARGGELAMSFDLFVRACVSLKRMTDVFKGYDSDRDGYVTLSFEEFLSEILKLREN